MPKTFDPRVVLGVLVVGLLALAPAAARADVVGPPPESCPAGSSPQSSHAGPLCVPMAECTSSAMCMDGAACAPVSQCIETRGCGGLRPPDSGPCTVEHVVGPCGAGDTCTTGVCRSRRVCTSGSTDDGGCACRAAGAPGRSRPLAVAAMLALACVLASRRRA